MNDGATAAQVWIVSIVLGLAFAGLLWQVCVLAWDAIRENRGGGWR